MAGRKTVPTAIKIANGNPGKRQLNKNEPTSDVGFEIPLELIDNEIAAESYVKWATLLTRINMMKREFQWIVIDVAETEAMILPIQKALRQTGGWVIGKNGGVVVDQRLYALASLKEQRRKSLEGLGLSPVMMAKLFALTPGASAIVGKGYAEQRLKQIDVGEAKQDEWQPPMGVTG